MEFVQKFVTTEVKYEFGDDSYGSDIFSNEWIKCRINIKLLESQHIEINCYPANIRDKVPLSIEIDLVEVYCEQVESSTRDNVFALMWKQGSAEFQFFISFAVKSSFDDYIKYVKNMLKIREIAQTEQENVCSSSESIDSCISDFSSISSTMSCYTGSIYSTVELDKILQEVMLFSQTQSSNTKISAVIKETTKTTTKKLKSVWNVIKKPKVLKKTFGHISSAMKTAQKLPSKLTKSSKSNSQNSDEVPFAIGGQRKINKKATKDDVKRFSFDSGVEMANKARTISVHAVERSYRGLSNHRNSMELIKKAKNLEWVWRDSLSTDTTSDTVSMFSIGNASDSDSSYDVISLPESNSFNGKSTISDELSTRSIEDLAELNSICCGKVKSIMKVNKRMKRQLPKLPQRKTTTFCENDSETSSVSEGIYSEIDLKGVEVGWMPAHEILDLNIERDEKVKFLNYEPNKKSNRRKDLFFYDKHNKSKGKSAWQRATGVFYKMFN